MKFVILHGTLGSPEDNWFPWLAGELEKLGHTVVRPKLPTPEGQSPENWTRIIKEAVESLGGPDDQIVFAAHSMSPLAVCMYLQSVSTPVKSCYFASGFAKTLDPDEEPFKTLNASFTNSQLDWDKVRANCKEFFCFAGDNDPYVSIDISRDFAAKLKTELIIVPGGGHLNTDSGYTNFPQLLDKIKQTCIL